MASGQVQVWARADWYWHLPAVGFEVAAHVGGGDAPRWFKLELRLVFLWLALRIDGKQPEPVEEDE